MTVADVEVTVGATGVLREFNEAACWTSRICMSRNG